jgi:hypothetical protein
MSDIAYKNGEMVQLGDVVQVRSFFFFKDIGTVVYMPGISPFHPDMKNGEIDYIGIRIADGGVAAATIDPHTNTVIHAKLIRRGHFDPRSQLNPVKKIFEEYEKD